MVAEVRPSYPSQWAAIVAVKDKLGIGTAETLRHWVRQAEVDAGSRPGVTTGQAEEVAKLKREVAELRRANEILKAASVYAGDACQAGVSARRLRRASYTARRSVWPLASASSRWAWMVGRCSMVVMNMVQDSQMVS